MLAERLRGSDPKRLAFFVTSRGVTNEVYYIAQKVARFLGRTTSTMQPGFVTHPLPLP